MIVINFKKFLFIHFLVFIDISHCESPLLKCPRNNPFILFDSKCSNFEDVCVKKEDAQCNNLINACQQCPSSNYTLPMLTDILKMLKTEIYEIRPNQTSDFKTIKSSIESIETFFTKEINFLKVQSNNETFVLKQKIDQLSKKLEAFQKNQSTEFTTIKSSIESVEKFFTKEINFLKVQLNNNETLVIKLKIDQLSKKLEALQKNQSTEFTTINNSLQNKINELQSEIYKLSGCVIPLLVIVILIFIGLFLEVRFKIITKLIEYCKKEETSCRNEGRLRVMCPPGQDSENPILNGSVPSCSYRANGPLLKSRKVNSYTEMKEEIIRTLQEHFGTELTKLEASLKSEIKRMTLVVNQISMNHSNYEENINDQSEQITNNIPDESAPLIPEEKN